MHGYEHSKIEKKWQKEWEEKGLYKASDGLEKDRNKYFLTEFPYPSGNLHVGHWYAFAVFDIYVRKKRMEGFNVMYPIGFDSFGLPAENAAIKRDINPRDWTRQNIKYMKEQLKSMGASFDFTREVVTSEPEYYKWTQWLFIQLFKKELAYQKETEVNWCPSCKTVLANEQVVAGLCERCDSEVQKKSMPGWNLKITDYAERLLDDLENLDWPEEIKAAQRAWIGKSEGAEIEFQIKDEREKVKVFTTRPDTLCGATYLVISPEHELLEKLRENKELGIENHEEVLEYVEKAKKKSDLERQEAKDKSGVELKGVKAINPATKEEIPIWVADYVLPDVGTGAIMAVPAHDERDFEFAKKFGLDVRPVVKPVIGPMTTETEDASELYKKFVKEVLSGNEPHTKDFGDLINSGEFDDLATEEAREKITKEFGEKKVSYRLRDWTVSRQRYWGCPIPIIHCSDCGSIPVPEEDLPVILPEIKDFKPTGEGQSPLAKSDEFVNTKCPECGKDAKRETDTLDTFVDSSWYYLRYTDPENSNDFASRERQDEWMPVDLYSGGAEHTTMHLLYSRFFHKALYDLGLVEDDEPYKRRMNRGLILGPDGAKMSKSKGNVIDPDEVVERLGADTVRSYLAFIGPYNETGHYPWDPDGVVGVRRFLEKVVREFKESKFEQMPGPEKEKEIALNKLIKNVSEDIDRLKFNTALAHMMKFVGASGLRRDSNEDEMRVKEAFLRLLAPFAPYLAEELWEKVGNKNSIHKQSWPEYIERLLVQDTVTIAVQIDGKVRAEMEVSRGADEEEVKKKALGLDNISSRVEGDNIERIIHVPDRLINIVTRR